MRSLVKRRAAAEPVAYLVGRREFFSLEFDVTPGVFIPRPETETLVMAALDVLSPRSNPSVLELCTGSGCISVALAKNHHDVRIVTIEKDSTALQMAQRNIEKHGVVESIRLVQGDLFDPIPEDEPFDLIVSNPPYIPSAEIPTLDRDIRDHEPLAALDGGEDGLDIVREIVKQAPQHLNPDSWLMFELASNQAGTAQELLKQHGFQQISTVADLSGSQRVVLGSWAG